MTRCNKGRRNRKCRERVQGRGTRDSRVRKATEWVPCNRTGGKTLREGWTEIVYEEARRGSTEEQQYLEPSLSARLASQLPLQSPSRSTTLQPFHHAAPNTQTTKNIIEKIISFGSRRVLNNNLVLLNTCFRGRRSQGKIISLHLFSVCSARGKHVNKPEPRGHVPSVCSAPRLRAMFASISLQTPRTRQADMFKLSCLPRATAHCPGKS